MAHDNERPPHTNIPPVQLIEEYRTLREAYERLMQEGEDRFKIVVEGVKDHAIIRTDLDGTIVDWNPGATNITGWKLEEVLGKKGAIIFSEEDLAKGADKQEMRIALQTGKAEDNRWHIRKDGTCFFAIGVMNLLKDKAGNPLGFVKVIRDFTLQKEAEVAQAHARQMTEESEARALQIANSLPMIVWTARPDGYIDWYNDWWYDYLGQPRGTVWDDIEKSVMHPDDIKRTQVIWPETVRLGKPFLMEQRFRRGSDGQYRWHLVRGVPVRDEHGNVVKYIGGNTDIHEQKILAEELAIAKTELEQKSGLLTTVLERAPFGISFIEASTGRSLLMNPRASEILGYDSETGEGFAPYKKMGAVHEDGTPYAEEEYPIVKALKTGATIIDEEMIYMRVDETKVHLSVSAGPVKNDGGEITGAVGAFFDLTERKRLVSELEEREENFRAIFDRAASGIARVMIDGHWEMVNERLCEIFQYSPSELHRLTFQEMSHPDDLPTELNHIDDMKAGKYDSFSMEKRYRRKNGTYVWVHLTKSLIRDEHGKEKSFIAVIEDISKRKKLEADLQNAKEAADSANTLKTAFLANMSHEIRTPIGVIQGFADLMSEGDLPEEQKRWVDTIRRNTRQLISLIGEVLDLSKVEADKLEVEKVTFRLGELVHDLRSSLSLRAEEKGLALIVQLDPDLPEFIESDPTRLRQILTNLIGNAIKFTDSGSVRTRFSRRDGNLVISISDTGIGLTPDQAQKIFDPFVQADNTMTRRFGGTGLGLSISRKLAAALGGELKLASSQLGKGSTFELTLCCLRNSVQTELIHSIPRPISPVDFSGQKILLVEDSPDNRMLLERMLKDTGASVSCEPNGKLGVERALSGGFDIILMDIQMPEMDGYTAIKLLRKDGYKKPVIALTAHALKEERERAENFGFNAYLTKPITKSTLHRTISEFMPKQ